MAAGVVIATVLTTAVPAFAVDDGEVPASKLSVQATLGIFVGIPAAIFAFIALLVFLPSIMRGPRYRPGRGWDAQPLWFGAPENAQSVLEVTSNSIALPEGPVRPEMLGGGASARW